MAKYPKLSGILKKLLYDKDMKPIDLARETNIPQPTIHRLVTGKSSRPYKSSLEPIADYFDLSIDQLLGIESLGDIDTKQVIKQKVDTIPLIAWSELQNIQKACETTKSTVFAGNLLNKDVFSSVIGDSSMEPMFMKGTTLIFDPAIKPIDRCFVLIKVANNTVIIFRQLLVDADHQYLKPLNPDLNQFQMRLLSENDTILGCLVESRNSFLAQQNPLDGVY